MNSRAHDTLFCRVCGRSLDADDRFCPNCGTPTGRSTPPSEPDPSTMETHRFATPAATPESQWSSQPGPVARPEPEAQMWGTPETTVAPESGNRTLWVLIGIIAMIVLVCCCILPLGMTIISGVDYNFQQEIRSF